jgi:hypothetical protein
MLLQSMLDLRPDLPARTLRVSPAIPSLFGRILMQNMRVGKDRVDVDVEVVGEQTRVGMTSRKGLRLLRGG